MLDAEGIPADLTAANYEKIRELMSGSYESASPESRSAAVSLSRVHNDPDSIEELLPPERPGLRTSFTAQINDVVMEPTRIDPQITTSPDLFLFTANSAIPIADAVRSFYDTAGIIRPRFGHIEAHSHPGNFYLEFGLGVEAEEFDNEFFHPEVRRLKKLYPNIGNVCVVDECVVSGGAIRFAAALLDASGLRHGSIIQGRWYQKALARNISLGENLGSTVLEQREFMRSIGVEAAKHSN